MKLYFCIVINVFYIDLLLQIGKVNISDLYCIIYLDFYYVDIYMQIDRDFYFYMFL